MIGYYRFTRVMFARLVALVLFVPVRLFAPHRPSRPAQKPQRILVQDGYRLGDLLLLSPGLRLLRAAFPEASIGLLTFDQGRALVEGSGWVDHTIVFRPYWAFRLSAREALAQVAAVVREMRSRRYDLAIDFRGDPRGLALLWLARIPVRLSFSDFGGGLFCSSSIATPRTHAHQLRRSLYLLNRSMQIGTTDTETHPVMPAHVDTGRESSARIGPTEPYAVIHPGSSQPSKTWEAARWVELIRSLAALGLGSVVVGTRAEEAVLEGIAAAAGGATRVDYPDFCQLAVLLSASRVVVCVDSFVQHAAWALRAPAVGLWGPSDPLRTAPYYDRYVLVWRDGVFRPPYATRFSAAPMSAIPAATVIGAVRLLVGDRLTG